MKKFLNILNFLYFFEITLIISLFGFDLQAIIAEKIIVKGKIVLESEDSVQTILKAKAIVDPEIAEPGQSVLLDGTKSKGNIDDFKWKQKDDSYLKVELDDNDSPKTSFIAPDVEMKTVLSFQLKVSNNDDTDTDSVEVTILPDSNPKEPTTSDKPENIIQNPVTMPFDSKEVETDPGGEIIENQFIVNVDKEIFNNDLSIIENIIENIKQIVANNDGNLLHSYNETIAGIAFNTFDKNTADDIIDGIQLIDNRIEIEQDVTVVPFEDEIPISFQRIGANYLTSLDKNISYFANFDIDIAVVDSGIDLDHPDLNVYRNVSTIKHQNFMTTDDLCGHGTHVAGIIGAKDNNYGIIGLVPDIRLWSIKAIDLNPTTGKCKGSISSLLAAIEFIEKNSNEIDIVNLSLGCKCNSNLLDKVITRVVDSNITVVVASGNLNMNTQFFSPANHPKVITVSAMTDFDGNCGSVYKNPMWIQAGNFEGLYSDDTFARFSNYGSQVSIAAPGVLINSTYLNGTYYLLSGTSMAAPHVTGTVALYKIIKPEATPLEIKQKLIDSGVKNTVICEDLKKGYFKEHISNEQESLLYIDENFNKLLTSNQFISNISDDSTKSQESLQVEDNDEILNEEPLFPIHEDTN